MYGMNLAEMAKIAKMHSSEASYMLDDPLEAAVFSVLIEMLKNLGENDRKIVQNHSSGRYID